MHSGPRDRRAECGVMRKGTVMVIAAVPLVDLALVPAVVPIHALARARALQ